MPELAVERDQVLGREGAAARSTVWWSAATSSCESLRRAPDVGDGVERLDVGVVDVEDAAVVLERGVVATEPVVEELGAAEEHRDARRGRRARCRSAARGRRRARPTARCARRGSASAAERLGILAAQIEHPLPGLDRLRDVVEPVGEEVRDLGADVGLLRRRRPRSRARARGRP